jgi:hypothetical protein
MKFVPEVMRIDLPIFKINPGSLVDDIAAILDRRAEWPGRGRMLRNCVERWHNPDTVAKAMLAAYRTPDDMLELNPDGRSPKAASEFQG